MGPTTQSTTHELLGLERKFWDAMREKDGLTAAQMTDARCIVVGAQGVSTIDRKTMEKLTVEGNWEIKDYTFDENAAQVLMVGDDVALVAYKVTERLVVEGTPLSLEANDASVWVRRDGKWLCAMHTESLAGDPFGRDRRASAA